MIGKCVSHFEIRERVGQGGMAAVYKAWDLRLKRHVALKVLHEELTQSQTKDLILHEAQAASKLEHPNIATIYDAFEDEGQTFLAMQLLDGGTLREKIEAEPTPIADAIRIALAIARGLEEAHRAGVLHRDVKPENVMFTRHGETKLTDFGLAKETATDATLTQTGVIRGTPAYLPPELLKGGRWSEQGDIYCAGVVLYEMLTQRRPFLGQNHHQIFRAILHEEPPSISRLRPGVPRRLEEIVVRALEKRPRDRYPNASTVVKELESLQQVAEAETELHGGRRVLSRRAKRRRVLVTAGMAVILALAAFVVVQRVFFWQRANDLALAVLPLSSLAGEDLDREIRTFARMLTTDLGESSHIRVLGSAGVDQLLRNNKLQTVPEFTADDLRQIARSANLSHVVVLSLFRGGSTLRADMEIIEMSSGQTIATANEEVVGYRNVINMIDPLASRAREAVLAKDQLATERDRPFGDITSTSSEAVALYYRAQEFGDELASVKAVDLYDQALALDPEFFLAKVKRAEHLVGNESFVEVGDIDNLSEYEVLYYRGLSAISTGEFEQLLEMSDQMLDLRPGDWVGLNHRYIAQYFLGHYEDAVETCERTVRAGYRHYPDHLLLNSSYSMSGMTANEIIDRYNMLLQEDPSDAQMMFWLAVTYLTMNRDTEAEDLLERVFEIHPSNDSLMKVLSDTYTWRESPEKDLDFEQALALLDRMRNLYVANLNDTELEQASGDSPNWLLRECPFSFKLGEVLLLQGQVDEAIDAYERGLQLDPEHYNSYYRLGVAYDQKGETEKALDYLERYIGVTQLNSYDATAQGRESGCAAMPVCHSISRPVAVADARQRLSTLRSH